MARLLPCVFTLTAFLSPQSLGNSQPGGEPPVLIEVAATEGGDAWNSLQSSIDRAAKQRGTVRLAAGVYSVSKPIVLHAHSTVIGAGMDRTTIRNLGKFPMPLVQFGLGKDSADHVTLQDFCVEQRVNDHAGSHCIHGEIANDVQMTRVRAKGSRYEGIIGGGYARRWTLDSCEADGCGGGGPALGPGGEKINLTSRSGINVNARDAKLIRCKTVRCGQGFEFGNMNMELVECTAEEPHGSTPSIAFNCGSASVGVSNVRILHCSSKGYPEAVRVGNGIGRLSDVVVENCTFTDGSITFGGGKPKNNVPTPDQGPDVSGSFIRDCTIRWTKPSDKTPSALLYYSGVRVEDKILGREPLTVQKLKVIFATKPSARVSEPVLGVAGHVSAPVVFRDCVIEGLDEAPIRGDGELYAVLANPLPSNTDHLRFINCIAKTSNGKVRKFIVKKPDKPGAKKAKKGK